MGKALIDLNGIQFGRLTVIEKAGHSGGKALWRCHCSCGAEKIVRGVHLRSGRQVSCGCHKAEAARQRMTKHGNAPRTGESRTYSIWKNMIQRCTNENNDRWPDYGGRGVKVCERWHSFANFLADMGEAPAGLTLDRRETDGDYEPGNCRWADWRTQMRNKRNNVWVEIDGARMVREDARKMLGLSNRAMNKLVAEQCLSNAQLAALSTL